MQLSKFSTLQLNRKKQLLLVLLLLVLREEKVGENKKREDVERDDQNQDVIDKPLDIVVAEEQAEPEREEVDAELDGVDHRCLAHS